MKQLETLSVASPGFFGLNTQESGASISPNFAKVSENTVIDKSGRLGARKGWVMRTVDGATDLAGSSITFLMEHVNADNSVVTISGGASKLFTGGADNDALTDITPSLYSITAGKWKGATLYDHALIVQKNHEPIIYNSGTSPVAQTITDYTGVTQSYGTNFPRDAMAAYGRFWVHDGSSIYWSTDIADVTFPAFNGGTSGFLNISAVLPNNVDTIVALAAHNGFLIIFCERNIVIYKGAENPLGDFSLSDVIAGVGCSARDSVQNTGNDLIFLSDTGVRSLGRLLQEKSLPLRDLTRNVRDDLIKTLVQERSISGDMELVKSVYSEVNAFYLVSFPSTATVYCLDMRQPLEDGSSRVSVWNTYTVSAFVRRRDREIMLGKPNGIGRYFGYTDNGNSFRLRYYSPYMDMGSPAVNKIVKQITATVLGGSAQSFIIKTNFDYEDSSRSYPFTLAAGVTYEYGIAEYGIAEYTVGTKLDSIKSSVGGSGNAIQIGFEADVNGSELSVQKIDIFVKTGRVS